MNSRRAGQLARGWALAAFATLVSAFVHVLAGGEMPGFLPVALALIVGGTLSAALIGRRFSLWRLTLGAVLSQAILHGLFSLGAGGTLSSAPSGVSSVHAGHGDVSALLGSTQTAASHGFFDHDGAMLVGHLVASVVTVVAVLYGTRAAVAVASAARLLVARVLRPAILVPVLTDAAHARAAVTTVVRPSLSGVFLSPMRHRGPPMPVLAR